MFVLTNLVRNLIVLFCTKNSKSLTLLTEIELLQTTCNNTIAYSPVMGMVLP